MASADCRRLGLFAAPQALAEVDMILTNGKIVTVDAQAVGMHSARAALQR
jgi:hypothetical protein